MGQNTYFVSAKLGRDLSLPFSELIFDNMSKEVFTDSSSFRQYIPSLTFFHQHGCREAIVGNMGYYHNKIFAGKDSKMIFGIRCFGETHSDVASTLRRRKNYREILRKFIEQLLGIVIHLDTGVGSSKESRTFPVTSSAFYKNEEGKPCNRISNKYITIYIRANENPVINDSPIKLSAIIWLLREQSLCRKILNGQIKTAEDLSRETLILASKRGTTKDKSFKCFHSTGLGGRSINQVWKNLNMDLSDPHNGDGSDFVSLVFMGIYFWKYSQKTKYNWSWTSTREGSGPVDFTILSVRHTILIDIKNNLDISKILQTICRRIDKTNQFSEYNDDREWLISQVWK